MPGKQTALTVRLEPSKRQFFQWHKVEQRPLSEIKRRMDELTEVLISAGYKYNFVAEKESWKSRSRHWNKQAKNAWNIETNQKGRALPIPKELANVPVWVEWDQDVGNWRNHKFEGENSSQFAVAQGFEHQESYGKTGHWEGQYQTSAATGADGAFQGSHASPSPLQQTNSLQYPSDLTINPGTTFPFSNIENILWPQHGSISFETIPLPLLPQPEQAHYALQDYPRGPSTYSQNYQTATPAFDAILPASNAIHGKEHELVSYTGEREPSYMSDMQPSQVYIESWSQQNSRSTVRDYTPKEKPSYRKDNA